jgi:hypothetical protein
MLDGMRARADWKADSFDLDVLPMAVAMEWVGDSTVLGDPADPAEQWRYRIEVIQGMLKKRQAAGIEESFEAQAWRTTLGLCLLNAGRNDEAEGVIDANIAGLTRTLTNPDDPWTRMVRKLKAVAVVRRLRDKSHAGPLSADARAELTRAADLLEESLAKPTLEDSGTIQQLVLEAITIADAPELLNRPGPAKQALMRAEVREIRAPSEDPRSPTKRMVDDAAARAKEQASGAGSR